MTVKNRRQLQQLLRRIEDRTMFLHCDCIHHRPGEYHDLSSECPAELGFRQDWKELREFIEGVEISRSKEAK